MEHLRYSAKYSKEQFQVIHKQTNNLSLFIAETVKDITLLVSWMIDYECDRRTVVQDLTIIHHRILRSDVRNNQGVLLQFNYFYWLAPVHLLDMYVHTVRLRSPIGTV